MLWMADMMHHLVPLLPCCPERPRTLSPTKFTKTHLRLKDQPSLCPDPPWLDGEGQGLVLKVLRHCWTCTSFLPNRGALNFGI